MLTAELEITAEGADRTRVAKGLTAKGAEKRKGNQDGERVNRRGR